ncbi:MAG: cyclopropane-fatty-acyl-phospholipid synthase, partial [Balneolales bacterium]
MKREKLKEKAEYLLETAGIEINGKRSHDIQVHDERLFSRVFSQGELGLGESYMDGWWDVPNLDEFFYRVIMARLQHTIQQDWHTMFELLR